MYFLYQSFQYNTGLFSIRQKSNKMAKQTLLLMLPPVLCFCKPKKEMKEMNRPWFFFDKCIAMLHMIHNFHNEYNILISCLHINGIVNIWTIVWCVQIVYWVGSLQPPLIQLVFVGQDFLPLAKNHTGDMRRCYIVNIYFGLDQWLHQQLESPRLLG